MARKKSETSEKSEESSEEQLGEDELAEAPVRKVPKSLPGLSTPPAAVRGGNKKDLLAYYLAEVRRHPLLSREEEHEYAVAFVEHLSLIHI